MTLRQTLAARRSTEHKLMDLVRRLFIRGAWLTTCSQRDMDSDTRRYKDAKKQYDDVLDECVTLIEKLHSQVAQAEQEFEKGQAFKQMENEHAARRKQWNDRNNPDET